MLERGARADFAHEPLGADCGRHFGPQDLDGDVSAMLQIFGEIDRRHPTVTQLPSDAIAVGQCRGER